MIQFLKRWFSSAVGANPSRRLDQNAEQEAQGNSLDGRWGYSAFWGSLAIAVLLLLLTLGGRFPDVWNRAHDALKAFVGAPSQHSAPALAAAPAVSPVAAGGAQGKSRKAKKPEAKKPERKSATPAPAVSEPSLAPPPKTKKRSPAPTQPASEPVASSPAPSITNGGGGSTDSPPQPPQPPQVQHGIGGSEGSHGIAPAGG